MLWAWPTAPEASGKPSRGLLLCPRVRDGNPEWEKVFALWVKDSQNLGLIRTIRLCTCATCVPYMPVHSQMLAMGSGICTSLNYLFLSHVTTRQKHRLLIPHNCLLYYSHFPALSLLRFQPHICRHFSQPMSNFLLPFFIVSSLMKLMLKLSTSTRYASTGVNHVPYLSSACLYKQGLLFQLSLPHTYNESSSLLPKGCPLFLRQSLCFCS